MAGEYSPARCTRDKPEAEEFFSASYLHPTAKVLSLLTQPAWKYYPAAKVRWQNWQGRISAEAAQEARHHPWPETIRYDSPPALDGIKRLPPSHDMAVKVVWGGYSPD